MNFQFLTQHLPSLKETTDGDLAVLLMTSNFSIEVAIFGSTDFAYYVQVAL